MCACVYVPLDPPSASFLALAAAACFAPCAANLLLIGIVMELGCIFWLLYRYHKVAYFGLLYRYHKVGIVGRPLWRHERIRNRPLWITEAHVDGRLSASVRKSLPCLSPAHLVTVTLLCCRRRMNGLYVSI